MEFHVDAVSADHIAGWAVSGNGVAAIRASCDGLPIATALTGIPRPDVGAAFPDIPGSGESGFVCILPQDKFRNSISSFSITIVENNGQETHVELGDVPTISSDDLSEITGQRLQDQALSPFPLDIQALLARMKPDLYEVPGRWSTELVEQAIADLIWLIKTGSRSLHALDRYLLYLRSLRHRFETIARLFPRYNSTASDLKTLSNVQSHPDEMLCISHHLLVLVSRGMHGPLAEFGCFKGFSSCCLSHACHDLGLELHVFDSFCGLPSSDSSYHLPGDFRGPFDEVTANIRALGKMESVQFHRGFFASTLANYRGSPMALWMDVDLNASARDVMQILPRIPSTSIVFTHECFPGNFIDGIINGGQGPDAVLPPIVAGFRDLGRDPAGCYLCGNTGAVWDRNLGAPPLGISAILAICDSI
jgi:O-methyltransferase